MTPVRRLRQQLSVTQRADPALVRRRRTPEAVTARAARLHPMEHPSAGCPVGLHEHPVGDQGARAGTSRHQRPGRRGDDQTQRARGLPTQVPRPRTSPGLHADRDVAPVRLPFGIHVDHVDGGPWGHVQASPGKDARAVDPRALPLDEFADLGGAEQPPHRLDGVGRPVAGHGRVDHSRRLVDPCRVEARILEGRVQQRPSRRGQPPAKHRPQEARKGGGRSSSYLTGSAVATVWSFVGVVRGAEYCAVGGAPHG